MQELMQPCACSVCLAREKATEDPDTGKLHKAFEKIMQWLHTNGKFKIKDIKSPVVQVLISETSKIFNKAIEAEVKSVKPSDTLIRSLKNSGYVFSSFKTLAQIKEAEQLLVDKNGNIKPFEQFLKDVQTIDETYNKHYLKAEYKFAVASVQMADKWQQFERDGDKYDLQYRTANDDRVRDSHAELHNVTLPVNSPFWDKYFPPNGWGCRCNVVQVRKGKYPQSNLADAIKKGDAASSGKYQRMFRFNPGKNKSLFPAHNPYTPSRCVSCSKNGFALAKIPDNELCAACPIIRQMVANREVIARRRKEIYKETMKNLRSERLTHEKMEKSIQVSKNGIKEFLNQPHKHIKEKNEILLQIKEVIKKSKYLGVATHYKEDQDFESHIFEANIAGEPSWIIVREYNDGKTLLHSVSDSETIKDNIKR